MITPPPPTKPHVRVTVSMDPDVLDVYKRVARASKTSLGRTLGEWLGDTVDAAGFMAQKMEQARAAPGLVARELHSYALGLTDATQGLMDQMRKGGGSTAAQRGEVAPFGLRQVDPPPSNTGGKVPPLATKAHKPTGKP